MKQIITILLAAIGLTTACGQRAYRDADAQSFARLIADSTVIILDVRTPAEFAESHIQGAINIDYYQSDFQQQFVAQMPTDRTIAIYCRSGRRSALAAAMLAPKGYRLVNLAGGIIAWREARLPLVTTEK